MRRKTRVERFSRFSTLPTKTGIDPPDVELVQPLLVAPEGQACQELLDGGVACPDGDEDEVALFVTDAAIGH